MCTPSNFNVETWSTVISLSETGTGGFLTTFPISMSFVFFPFTVIPILFVVSGQLVMTDAFVSVDNFEFIVGSEWLAAHHCNWYFRNSCISVNGGECIQLNERRTVICGRVYADTDVVIPPKVQRNVLVQIVVSKPSCVIGDTLVESICTSVEHSFPVSMKAKRLFF